MATKAPLSLEPQFVAIVKKLLKRGFQERDEQCRLEVFGALETILRASSAKRHAPAALQSLVSSVSRDIGLAAAKWSTDSVSKKDKEFGVKRYVLGLSQILTRCFISRLVTVQTDYGDCSDRLT